MELSTVIEAVRLAQASLDPDRDKRPTFPKEELEVARKRTSDGLLEAIKLLEGLKK